MTGLLEDKVVLVTGAGSGIGRASARLFAAEGARLVLADLNAEGLEETQSESGTDEDRLITVPVDLREGAQVDQLVARAVSRFGQLDAAFNNAGVTGGQIGQGGKLTADWDEDAFDAITAINLKGTWLCMRAQIRQMLTQESGGAILNTASLAGITGFPTTTGYAGTKHGVVGMTKTAALEYAPKIRFNALCPGYVNTPMLADTMSRRADAILAKIPFGRLAEPVELAQMACFLLSDRASYCSGGVYTVDGAYMAG